MAKKNSKNENLSENLKQLIKISEWFDNQEEINIEQGLKKLKEATVIIKASRKKLKNIENEFEEIKKEMESEEK